MHYIKPLITGCHCCAQQLCPNTSSVAFSVASTDSKKVCEKMSQSNYTGYFFSVLFFSPPPCKLQFRPRLQQAAFARSPQFHKLTQVRWPGRKRREEKQHGGRVRRHVLHLISWLCESKSKPSSSHTLVESPPPPPRRTTQTHNVCNNKLFFFSLSLHIYICT